MLALLDLDMRTGVWQADVLHGDDLEWVDHPPTEKKWRSWLAAAVEFQAIRGGGIFIAAEPT